jgi:hypothetical protein
MKAGAIPDQGLNIAMHFSSTAATREAVLQYADTKGMTLGAALRELVDNGLHEGH